MPSGTAGGYLLVGGDGDTFAFPDAVFPGTLSGVPAGYIVAGAPTA